MPTNVKSYTDKQLLDRMKSLHSYKYMPNTYHIIAVRSNEDTPDQYDDKLYLFNGEKFIMAMSCTTNSGLYGLTHPFEYNSKGTAVIKSDEVYYDSFEKSDGSLVAHHNGKVQCLRQIKPLLYYRDANKNNKVNEVGIIYEDNYSTNIHPNSYSVKQGILSWIIGKWSVGCIVVNDLTKYYEMLNTIPLKRKITLTLLEEF